MDLFDYRCNFAKKISTVASQPVSTSCLDSLSVSNDTYWKVTWTATPNGHGTTEPGSSGSALLNSAHKVIGQLYGGFSSCDSLTSPDWYGRFNMSWTGPDNPIIQRRLDHWLNPNDIGGNMFDGLWVIKDTITISNTDCQYSHVKISGPGMVTVQSTINMNDRSFIVDSGGKLIVDGGTLNNVNMTLKPGASLLITNGGIVKTSHGFVAPVGSTVTVLQGKIE